MADKATASENVVDPTGNTFLDTLILGHRWNDDHPVTFYFDDGALPEDVWLAAAKDALREAFSTYEMYIDLSFEEVDNQADANFVLRMNSLEEIGATASFGYPDEGDHQAVGQFPFDWSRWTDWHLQTGGYAFETVLHEIGHGLGLEHPHGSDGLNGQPFPGVTDASEVGDDGQNSGVYTVMSYLDHSQFWAPVPASSDLGWGYIASPMGLDIAALQHIYGANPSANPGHSTYTLPTVNGDGTYWRAIWDTGGSDLIRHDGTAPATIDLRAAPLVGPNAGGYLSRVEGIAGGFTIANGVTIEYAEGGGGDDTIHGNGAANEIAGRGGDDVIMGRGGADLIDGGAGDDTLYGGTGNDTLVGGAGDDRFLVDSALDVLHEGAGGGTDTVVTTISYTLAVNFENLHLAESSVAGISGRGNAADNQIIGNSDGNLLEGRGGDDFVSGGAGNDLIDGGTGADTLLGGAGDDLLDGGADQGAVMMMAVPGGAKMLAGPAGMALRAATGGAADPRGLVAGAVRDPGRGIDAVLTDHRAGRVADGDDDELRGGAGRDTLIGRGGDDLLWGEAGDDQLLGGKGADWLDGGGGKDAMAGGAGDDIYVVDSPFDTVVESAGQGIDGVFSAVDHALANHVENLVLVGAPDHHIAGTGNGLANWIIGNDASNVIDGLGGDDILLGLGGNDFMDGGTGADLVYGGWGDDVLDGGDDAVVAGPAYAAPGFAGGFADTLHGGAGDDIVFGRGGGDLLYGEAGDDALHGESGSDTAFGGEGDDTVDGGAGSDSLLGEGGDDSLSGGGGNDRLNGGVGNDTLDGGAGADTMVGGGGDDVFLVESAGDLVLEGLGLGTDVVFATISYTLGDNVEHLALLGSASPDIAGTGNALANVIVGNDGANAIAGLDGDDVLVGFGGDDALTGGEGADSLHGGEGADDLRGEAGDDLLYGNGGDDSLRGGGGDDVLAGGGGDDELRGNQGQDTLLGGDGADTLRGQAGDDTLEGGAGDDRLIGGAGADRFDFSGAFGTDLVTDFDPDEGDRLAISGFGAGLDDFAELIAHVSDDGTHTTIDLTSFGGGTILLANVVGLQPLDVELFA